VQRLKTDNVTMTNAKVRGKAQKWKNGFGGHLVGPGSIPQRKKKKKNAMAVFCESANNPGEGSKWKNPGIAIQIPPVRGEKEAVKKKPSPSNRKKKKKEEREKDVTGMKSTKGPVEKKRGFEECKSRKGRTDKT